MRILLINPKSDEGKFGRLYHSLPFYVNAIFPPLGLAYIGAVLEKSDNEVTILDANALDLEIDKIVSYAKDFKPDIIGITCQITTLKTCLSVAKIIKKEVKSIKIILGGPVFIFKTIVKETLRNSFIDFIVIGEGEETVVKLVDALKNSNDLSEVDGIGYKKKNKIVFTASRKLIENLNSIPFPAYHLLPTNKYKLNNNKVCCISTSRGCVFDCKFCGQNYMWGRKVRLRNAKNIVDEIEHLYKNFSVRWFKFTDDLFTFNSSHIKNVCKEIIKRKLKIKWTCQTRVDFVDEEMLKLMKKVGCISICYGVESGSEKTLQYIRKNISLNLIKNTFRLTRKNGIYPQASFIIGFPHEDEKEIEKTVEFAKKLRAINYGLNILFPIPNTPIYKEIERKRLFSKPFIRTTFLSSRELIKIANRKHTNLLIAGLLNLFVNSLARIIENPLETFEVLKEFGRMFL